MNSSTAGFSSGSKLVTTSIDHPRLTSTDASSTRAFLCSYDQYSKEIVERARQLVGQNVATTETVRPVGLKFCVDPEWLESITVLGFIDGVSSSDELTDERLRSYLESKTEESKERITLDVLDGIVDKELRMNMRDANAKSRMENLFVSYHCILRRHGLSWILEDSEEVAVFHIVSAIRPDSLRHRLEADLDFAYHELRKNFKAFMRHAIRLSEAFQLLDCGRQAYKIDSRRSKSRKSSRSHLSDKEESDQSSSLNTKKELPVCLYGPHKEKGYRHYLRDCRECPEEERKTLFRQLAEERARTGPSKSTRGQKSACQPTSPGEAKPSRTAGRLNKLSYKPDSPSFPVTVTDEEESMTATGRTDDGSDESIVSSRFAESAVLNGIGKFRKIDKVVLQVALKDAEAAQQFTFSRTWTPPRTVLRLVAGPLALTNVTFLVADAELAVEDLLIGLPVLQHLGVDTKTLLERSRDVLDGTDCSRVQPSGATGPAGHVSRLMIARLNRVTDDVPTDSRPRVDYYTVRQEEDLFPDKSLLDPLDSTQHDEIVDGIQSMMKTAIDNGFPPESAQNLRQIVADHMDIFRSSFSSGPPAKVEPLKIDLVRDASPVRVRLRNNSPEQRAFLSEFVSNLVSCGMAYSNPSSPWASAPLLVPKPGPSMFRFTVDLRPVNRFTIRHQFPMPNVEQELLKLAGSQYFATFDLSHGYWQFPLDESSRATQSFITPDGIFTPTRVLHGSTNAVMYLQSTLATNIPAELRPHLLYWLDDILIFAVTVSDFLQAIRHFLDMCACLNLRLHPAKCVLYSSTIRWCGRLISPDGFRFDPRRIDGIREMSQPTNGAHLQQFVCALQWMRSAIPSFSSIVRPLSSLLEDVYARAGKRTKTAVARVSLSKIGWNALHDDAFDDCKRALEHQVTLAHYNTNHRTCVYTDASDFVWSGIVTQVLYSDLPLPHAEQRHEPLAFLSGHFTGPQLGWSVLEKEAYAILSTVNRMHWILGCPAGFDLFTDHHNLIFLFDPLAVVSDLSQTSLRKVLRWAVRLSAYNYTCVHVKGTDNVWADLLGRWSAPAVIRRLVYIPTLPSSSSLDFDWPSLAELVSTQDAHNDSRPPSLGFTDGLWRNASGAVWVPDDATDLHLRLCVIAHTGPSGHRGARSTSSVLSTSFFWSTVCADVDDFVRACIHCLSTTGGGRVPRPFGPAFHGTMPNDLLQFDYVEIAPSITGEKYVLMLRDDHSSYSWFFSFPDTSAENAAREVVDWCAAFGAPGSMMSDGPTHFKNDTIRRLAKGLRVPHHFTLPYCPWSNGAVERLGKELIRVFRSLLSELKMQPNEWPDLLPLVQSALNNAPSPQRKNIAPVTAFTGMDPSPPISSFLRSKTHSTISLSSAQCERAINISKLQSRIAKLHPLVQNSLQASRDRQREALSRGKLANFQEGDFVLVAREDFTAGEKLSLRWRGPRRVIKAMNDYVFQVEDLRNGSVQDIHGSRLKFYSDSSLDREAIMPHVVNSETGMPVQRLMRFVKTDKGLMVQVRWRGLSELEDTLEPVENIFQDVPQLFKKLLERKNTPLHLADEARRVLRL